MRPFLNNLEIPSPCFFHFYLQLEIAISQLRKIAITSYCYLWKDVASDALVKNKGFCNRQPPSWSLMMSASYYSHPWVGHSFTVVRKYSRSDGMPLPRVDLRDCSFVLGSLFWITLFGGSFMMSSLPTWQETKASS